MIRRFRPLPGDGDLNNALHAIAESLKNLGNGDASTQMGAIENLSKEVKEGTERVAYATERVADALYEIACALHERNKTVL